ncbi:MAG TPA: DUF4236 domain-containing protein [Luteibacter sp.]|jgi:hypothetical protein|uniref:DUF4236 domain-containing protein n=1 Tax=Luteibacter sp. TaxID=1886636 RepID=UPI002F3F6B7A
MPFYFRHSIKAGPFRVNLSKSGVGLSVGVRGFRVGVGPKGHYIHAGGHGIYYRQTGQFRKSTPVRTTTPQAMPEPARDTPMPEAWVTEDGVVMRRVISDTIESMSGGSRQDAVDSLNEARRRLPLFGPSAVFGVVASLFAMANLGQTAAVLSVALLTGLAAFAHRIDAGRRGVVFAYDLSDAAKATFENLTKSMDAVGRAQGLWFVDATGAITNLTAWKRNAGASQLVSKKPTSVRYEMPPGVHSNVTPPSIRVQSKTLYFLPDCVLVRDGTRYGSVSYQELQVATRPGRFIVESAPRDAEVVGHTWQHPRKDGGPDRRFANNRQLPVCLFEEFGLLSPSGLKAALVVSHRAAASAADAALHVLARETVVVKATAPALLDYTP